MLFRRYSRLNSRYQAISTTAWYKAIAHHCLHLLANLGTVFDEIYESLVG